MIMFIIYDKSLKFVVNVNEYQKYEWRINYIKLMLLGL